MIHVDQILVVMEVHVTQMEFLTFVLVLPNIQEQHVALSNKQLQLQVPIHAQLTNVITEEHVFQMLIIMATLAAVLAAIQGLDVKRRM